MSERTVASRSHLSLNTLLVASHLGKDSGFWAGAKKKSLKTSQDFYKIWLRLAQLSWELMCTVGSDFLPNHPS
jgi:hypothetical protein